MDPRYEDGERVMIRCEVEINDCRVTEARYLIHGETEVQTIDETWEVHSGASGWFYSVDISGYWFKESVIFPYQQPGDDFKTILAQVSDPSTITNPVTGPILEPA